MVAEGRTARGRTPVAGNRSVRVYSEIGITVAITDDPPQFAKVTVGHERMARNDTDEEIERAEARAYKVNEKIVERRLRQMVRLARGVEQQEDTRTARSSRSRRRGSS